MWSPPTTARPLKWRAITTKSPSGTKTGAGPPRVLVPQGLCINSPRLQSPGGGRGRPRSHLRPGLSSYHTFQPFNFSTFSTLFVQLEQRELGPPAIHQPDVPAGGVLVPVGAE